MSVGRVVWLKSKRERKRAVMGGWVVECRTVGVWVGWDGMGIWVVEEYGSESDRGMNGYADDDDELEPDASSSARVLFGLASSPARRVASTELMDDESNC